MASNGELVKLGDGRWARYQECRVCSGPVGGPELPILVAVELDDASQRLLADAEENLVRQVSDSAEVNVRLQLDRLGRPSVQIQDRPALRLFSH